MTTPDALSPEMRMLQSRLGKDPQGLDDQTVDRLLTKALPPDDAPPPYRDVARVISELTREGTSAELDVESRAVAGIAAAIASSASPPSRRSSMSRKLLSTKRLAVLATAAALTLFGGLAAAGVLPGVAEPDGIDVPGPNDASNGHTDVRGKSADHLSGDSEDDEVTTENSGKGADISDLATSTDSTGVDKGAEISDAASGGQSQAGEEHPGANVLPTIPATVPDEGDEGISHRP